MTTMAISRPIYAPCLFVAALSVSAARASASESSPLGESSAGDDGPVVTEVKVRQKAVEALVASSGSGTKMSEAEIKRAAPTSTAEMLRRAPGITVRSEDGMGLRLNLGVRGLSPTRSRLVLVQEDGVPVVVSPYGEPEMYYTTPVERVQRLDVLKGPEVLLTGPQTVGGVVNLYAWAAPFKREAALELDYGQRDYGKVLARFGDSTEDGDVRFVVQAMHKEGSGFRAMPFHVNDAMGKLAFPTWKNGTAVLKAVAYEEGSSTTYTGLTEPLYRSNPRLDTVAPGDSIKIQRYELSLQHEQRLGARSMLRTTLFAYTVNLKIGLQDFDRSRVPGAEYARVLGPEGLDGAALFMRSTYTLRHRDYYVLGIEPQLEHHLNTGSVAHKLLIGTRIMADIAVRQMQRTGDGTTPAMPLSDDTTSIMGVAAYASDRIALRDSLVLTPAFRVEHAEASKQTRRVLDQGVSQLASFSGTSANTGFMPGVSLVLGKPQLNAFGGVHSGYSPPRVSQSITPTGQDASLDAERSMNYELGAKWRPSKHVRVDATGFLTNFDNQLISNNTLSGTSAEFKNGGKTRHVGAEVTAQVRFGKALHLPLDVDLSGQYTRTRSTFVGGTYSGNFVPYAPENTSTVTLDGEHKAGFGAQISWSHVGPQYADEANTQDPDFSGRAGVVPAYDVVDVGARYKHAKSGVTLALYVKNALDQVYLSSRLPNGIFTSGYRQAFLSLKWSTN